MEVQPAGADQQDLGRQQCQPTHEGDGVDVDDGRIGRRLGFDVLDDLGDKTTEDPDPDQGNINQEEITVRTVMTSEALRSSICGRGSWTRCM
jgi:hypothetical protein